MVHSKGSGTAQENGRHGNDHLIMNISVISTPAVSAAEARTDTELPAY